MPLAKVIQFPDRNNPSDDDIALLMRTSIKLYWRRAIENTRNCAIILAQEE